ncbi:hypothetical protein COLO4_00226 [Corchorus olitorius]|uniref:Uncharacterized protein n=1 Tax=Corchorus olitorius TaxID=93759 RepID=A0A1R3L4A9_9ROSI|nr:hypothetical protein COLO4_00226 [Corchorus olitorius]
MRPAELYGIRIGGVLSVRFCLKSETEFLARAASEDVDDQLWVNREKDLVGGFGICLESVLLKHTRLRTEQGKNTRLFPWLGWQRSFAL